MNPQDPQINALGTYFNESTDKPRGTKNYDDLDEPKAVRDARGPLKPDREYPQKKAAKAAKERQERRETSGKASLAARKNPKSKEKAPLTRAQSKKVRTFEVPDAKVLESEMTDFYHANQHDTPSENCTNGCTVNSIGTTWATCPAHSLLLNNM